MFIDVIENISNVYLTQIFHEQLKPFMRFEDVLI